MLGILGVDEGNDLLSGERHQLGDTILTTVRGKTVRMRVNRMHVHGSESGVYFSIYGTRFRKDGTLGKRDDMVVLNVDEPNSRRR